MPRLCRGAEKSGIGKVPEQASSAGVLGRFVESKLSGGLGSVSASREVLVAGALPEQGRDAGATGALPAPMAQK